MDAIADIDGRLRPAAATRSIEILPRIAPRADFSPLPAGTEVFVTHLPGAALAERAGACRIIAAAGHRPVPHIAAREAESIAALDADVAALRAAGASAILVIGGGGAPRGPFNETADVLASGVLARHGVTRLYLAAHPEGHPDADAVTLSDALRRKLRLAAFADVTLITQFGFDAAPILAFVEALRAEGEGVPVRVGLSGPANARTVLAFAMRCGVGPSLNALRGRGRALTGLLREWRPDALAGAITHAAMARPELGLAGLHLFPFGGFDTTARWLAETAPHGPALAPLAQPMDANSIT